MSLRVASSSSTTSIVLSFLLREQVEAIAGSQGKLCTTLDEWTKTCFLREPIRRVGQKWGAGRGRNRCRIEGRDQRAVSRAVDNAPNGSKLLHRSERIASVHLPVRIDCENEHSTVAGDPMTDVLLAEDNAADVYLIREALREHGVDCHLQVASDGQEVLDALIGDPLRAGALKLIILDLNLPRHDGIEILERLRDTGLARIPVVVLTSSDSQRDRDLAIRLGAVRFLRKPSGLDQFLSLGAVFKELLANSNAASESA